MKSYKYIFLSVLFLGLFACEDELNIDPQQSLSTDLAFSNEQASLGSLMGVYSRTQDLEVFGSMPQIIADYQSDNVSFIGSFPTLQDVNNFVTLSDNSSIETIWRDNYRAIFAANAVIKNVPDVDDPGFSAEEKAQYVAEAKFVRSYVFFQMANLFGDPYTLDNGASLAIPMVLDPFEGDVTFPERATVKQIYDQIKTDLVAAEADLPETHGSDLALTLGRATKGSANALLSRIALYTEDWQGAADYADKVINSSVYQLAAGYNFYSQNTPEEVFSLQNSATDNGRTGSGGWASFYNPAEAGARGDCPFSQDLLDAYAEEAGDKRFSDLTQVGANEATYTTKFPDPVNNSDNVPLIRITEMYLNRAEALAELNGVNQASVDLINDLRDRAGLADWTTGQFGSNDAFLDAIANERRKELAFEGHRRMDLLRRGLALRPADDPKMEDSMPGKPKTILPVPQREVDLNQSLVQNDGY